MGTYVAMFNKHERVKLGVDLIFDVGALLSENTYIEEITVRKGTNIIDGEVRDDVVPVDTYYVYFKIDNHEDEHSIVFNNQINGSLNVGKYYVSFGRKGRVSTNDYEVRIRDKSVHIEPKHKGKRPNDKIILPVDKEPALKKTKHFRKN